MPDIMSEALSPEAPASTEDVQPSDIRGLVDNATGDRIFGWAWDANRIGYRLPVELRLSGEVLERTIADLPRPDLAQNSIGDGRHAFEFPLLPEWAERGTELAVVAIGADGREFPIAVKIRRAANPGGMPPALQRTLDALVAGERETHAQLQELAKRLDTLPPAELQAGLAASHRDLQERLQALEIWLARLDEQIPKLIPPPPPPSGKGLAVGLAIGLTAIATAAVVWAAMQFSP